jgi:hypothetical protein
MTKYDGKADNNTRGHQHMITPDDNPNGKPDDNPNDNLQMTSTDEKQKKLR